MAAHDAAPWLRTAIESVLAQTHDEWELIVADDASGDGTAELAEQIAARDPRIRVVRRASRGGPAVARNQALAAARGRYVAFLDADDWWLPEKLERQLAFIGRTGAALAYTAYRRTDGSPGDGGRLVRVPSTTDYRDLLGNTAIATSTVLIDRSRTGPFKMPRAAYDDFACWLGLLRRGFTARGLQEDLTRYRTGRGSVSANKLRSAGRVWRVYRRTERLPFLVSCFHFSRYAYHAVRKRLGR